jgi:hypothetical protein
MSYSVNVRKDRMPVSEVKALYVKSQRMFRTFPHKNKAQPGLSSSQLRAYLVNPWPDMDKNHGTFSALTHRDTSLQDFKSIIRVFVLYDEIGSGLLSPEKEKEKVKELHEFVKKNVVDKL